MCFNEVKEKVTNLFKSNPSNKIKIILKGNMERHILTELRYKYRHVYLHSKNEVNLPTTNVKELYQKVTEDIFEHIVSMNAWSSLLE